MIKIYDTQKRQKVDFIPKEEGKVSMYVCGPTVYNRIHIGNARTFISFDMIRRYFIWRGYDVKFVQNITDVDDKIIARSLEENRSASEVASDYTDAFIEDMHAIGVIDPDVRPKATHEIDEMVALVERLIENGHAYVVEGDVYFDVRSDKHYGHLSGRNIDEMEAGHRNLRTDDKEILDRKRDPLDFALWKSAKPGEPSWESPWGNGRPGWHIECSAMSRKYLGLPFDIHGGGQDLVFPHHENECAQTECAYESGFANYWMHSGMLLINSEKMSKSLGNFMLLHEILEETRPASLRMLMAQTHYRNPLDFSPDRVNEANAALQRIENTVSNIDWLASNSNADNPDVIDHAKIHEMVSETQSQFMASMDDDFNAPAALGHIFNLVSSLNAELPEAQLSSADAEAVISAKDLIEELMGILGIDISSDSASETSYPSETVTLAYDLAGYGGNDAMEAVEALIEARSQAKSDKDWGRADSIRDGLIELGFLIEDTPQGAKVTYQG